MQQQLVEPGCCESLEREHDDRSLLFQAAPGPLREVQLIRDRVLQWLAADPELEPRDVLVMTPQVDRYAPLLSSVFNDRDAIGVDLPWRLTDRSQQSTPGLTMATLELLDLAAGRLTATGLERLLANPALQAQQGFSGEDAAALTSTLQRTGFRWGLDARERGGDETHSLIWSLDRWLLGLALPQRDGLAPGGTAPFHQDLDPQRLVRWWTVLDRLVRWLQQLRRPRASAAWVELLQALLEDLFADGGDWSWERQSWSAALADWQQRAAACPLELEVAVAAEVLAEALSVDSGRFGHRSGALTVSALEPMRAIPHKVIVLMGLDDGVFPRIDKRPGFHLLEQRRWLGDPRGGDQDRYVLLEALMSARRHLLISWCGRNEHTGEPRPAAAPVEQWLQDLSRQLGTEASAGLCIEPDPNPLDRSNFQVAVHSQPLSCDRRQLEARRWLDRHQSDGALGGLALPLSWSPLEPDDTVDPLSQEQLLQWLVDPQSAWLRQLGLHPSERVDSVEDLEALALSSLLQAQLLNQNLEDHLLAAETPAWCETLAGQGVLPPGAGAELEQGVLNHRLQALQQQLNRLGGCRREGTLLFAGDIQVVVQPGRFSPRGLMRGWLQHLQLCADAADFGGSAVIARADKGDEAKTHVRWIRLEPSDAEAQLQSLQRLAQQGQHQCWPVPPKSGWLLMSREHNKAGSGVAAFQDSWIRERQDPQRRLCFGAEAEADQLLQSEGFEHACALLYTPLLQALVC